MKKRWILALVMVVALVSGLVGTACAPAEEAPPPVPTGPEYKIALAAAEVDPMSERAHLVMIDLINARGDGRVEITYFPHAVLGSLESGIDQVSAGSIEISHAATGNLVRFVPWASIAVDLPFAWTKWDAYYRWHEKIWIPEINKELAAFNMLLLAYVGNEGASGIYSAIGPIRSPADVKGKIFRAFSPGIEVAWMEAMGAKGVVVPWAELYTALETGIVDLMHNPPNYAATIGFAEVTGDFTVTDHKIWINPMFANLEWWNSLPEDVQALVDGAWYEAATVWKWILWESHDYWIAEIQKPPWNMNVYYPTAAEMDQFKAAVAPVYDWARDEYGDDKVDMMMDYAE